MKESLTGSRDLINCSIRELERQLGGLNVEGQDDAIRSRSLPHILGSHNERVFITPAGHCVPELIIKYHELLMMDLLSVPASHKELLVNAGPHMVGHVMLSDVYNPVERVCPNHRE